MWLLDNGIVYHDKQPLTAGWNISGRGHTFSITTPDCQFDVALDGFFSSSLTVSGPTGALRIKRQGRSWFVLDDDVIVAKYAKGRFSVLPATASQTNAVAMPDQRLLAAAALVCWKMENPDVYI